MIARSAPRRCKEVMKVAKIAKIDDATYFETGDSNPLKKEEAIDRLLLQLTKIVNSVADRINDADWDSLERILKKTEERVARLEEVTRGNAPRGLGG